MSEIKALKSDWEPKRRLAALQLEEARKKLTERPGGYEREKVEELEALIAGFASAQEQEDQRLRIQALDEANAAQELTLRKADVESIIKYREEALAHAREHIKAVNRNTEALKLIAEALRSKSGSGQ